MHWCLKVIRLLMLLAFFLNTEKVHYICMRNLDLYKEWFSGSAVKCPRLLSVYSVSQEPFSFSIFGQLRNSSIYLVISEQFLANFLLEKCNISQAKTKLQTYYTFITVEQQI